MISTGLEKLDEFFGGGIPNGVIIDIYGPRSSGKTHLAMQISINSIIQGGRVLFLDTTGGFRPERMLEIIKSRGEDPKLLDNITVGRITNTKEQKEFLSKISNNNFSLVVIDNLTDLFSFEYFKEDQYLEKNISLMKYMHQLSQIATQNKFPIVITNMVTFSGTKESESLSKAIDIFTHFKIILSKNNGSRTGKAISPFKTSDFCYKISTKGLSQLP